MNQVLSILLILPLLCTQAWAVRGGPYDGLQWRGISALAGTYGVAMRGMRKDPATRQWSTESVGTMSDKDDPLSLKFSEPNPGVDDVVSTTAVLYLTVPTTGICSGRMLLFHKGFMYFGSATGMVERRSMKITLLSELSHYSVYSGATYTQRTSLNVDVLSANVQSTALGVNAVPKTILDFMLAGQIDLDISMDYFTGLVNLDGFANYVEVGSNLNTSQYFRRSVLRDLTEVTEVNGVLTTSNNPVENVISSPETTRTIQGTGTPNDDVTLFNGVKLKATGARQSTDVTPQQAFIAPSAATAWQIGAPVTGGS